MQILEKPEIARNKMGEVRTTVKLTNASDQVLVRESMGERNLGHVRGQKRASCVWERKALSSGRGDFWGERSGGTVKASSPRAGTGTRPGRSP